MTEPKKCKLCGSEPTEKRIGFLDYYHCENEDCDNWYTEAPLDAWNRLNSTILDEINDYYQRRRLKEPDALEALMWLISEVGEQVDAYLHDPNVLEKGDILLQYTFYDIIDLCNHVEEKVASRSGWTRNNQPKGTYDLPGEAGDVLMMLAKFCQKAGLPEPDQCLREKMARKLEEMNAHQRIA